MRLILLALSLAAFPIAAGCGGSDDSSGIDRSRTVSTLDSDEQEALCEFAIDAAGGAGAEFECGDDVTVTVDTEAECLADLSATANCTVGQLEDCALSDPCDFAPCLPLLSCGE